MNTDLEDDRLSVKEQAAQWLCELIDESFDQRAEFVAWLRASPRHIEEFLLTSALWKELEHVGPADMTEVNHAIANALALARQEPTNVVSLRQTVNETPKSSAQAPRSWSRSVRFAAVSAGLALLTALSWQAIRFFTDETVYTTAVGEQRSIRLTDGSVVHLNTQSRLEVEYSNHARALRLLSGEAFFNVARDAHRPFSVDAGKTRIQALGTQFNVYRRSQEVTVAVLEGAVQLTETAAAKQPPQTIFEISPIAIKLDAGERANVSADGRINKQARPDIADAVAWRERRLVFRSQRLEDIAREFGRYGSKRIRVEGELARDKRLTASFASDDPESLVLFLEKLGELTVQRNDDEFVVRER